MPSGAIGDCGRMPSRVATSLVGSRWMLSPSSSTDAGLWLEQPGEGAQQRRLAAGVGADDAGDLARRDLDATGRGRPRAGRRRGSGPRRLEGVVRRRVVSRSSAQCQPPLPTRLARASSQMRYGAPMMPVTTPTGSSVGGEAAAGRRGRTTSSSTAPTSAGGDQGERCVDQPAGDRGGDERDERDGAGRRGGDGGERDADEHQQRRGSARPGRRDPWRCRRRAAACAAAGSSEQRAGTSTSIASRDRADVVPAAAVERAGQPHRGALRVVDLGPGQQVRRDRRRAPRRHRCRRGRAGTTTPRACRRARRSPPR